MASRELEARPWRASSTGSSRCATASTARPGGPLACLCACRSGVASCACTMRRSGARCAPARPPASSSASAVGAGERCFVRSRWPARITKVTRLTVQRCTTLLRLALISLQLRAIRNPAGDRKGTGRKTGSIVTTRPDGGTCSTCGYRPDTRTDAGNSPTCAGCWQTSSPASTGRPGGTSRESWRTT